GVLMVRLDLPPEEYPVPRRSLFLTEVLQRISGLPGVRQVGATNAPPFGAFQPNNTFVVEGREPQGKGDFLSADWRAVSPGFFRALGIPLRRGRLFTEADREGSQDVIVISQTMADRLWPGEDPVGRRILWGDASGTPMTIVGVVGDVRDMDIEEVPRFVIFALYQQVPWPQVTLMIKTAEGAPGLAAAIRREIRALDGDLPIPE